MRETRAVASDGAGAAYARAFVQTRPGQRSLVVLACLVLYGVAALIGLSSLWQALPILITAVLVGIPLLIAIAKDAVKLRMGADVLGLLALVTGALMQEWLVVGIIALSVIGMGLAVFGLLPPLAGAIAQEVIDVLAILNATRVGLTRKPMSDFRR